MWILLCVAYAAPDSSPAESVEPASTPADEAREGDSVPDPEVYDIPEFEGELPTALDGSPPQAEGELSDALAALGLDVDDYGRPQLIRWGWFGRPRVAFAGLVGADEPGGIAVRLGGTVGLRASTAEIVPIQVAAALGVEATAPVGDANGYRFEPFARVGPWLGPVQVSVGMRGRFERERWRDKRIELSPSVQLGPSIGIGLDAGPVLVNAGWSPGFQIAGDRASANEGTPVLPALGFEDTYRAGIMVEPGWLRLRVDGTWRDTAVGSLVEVGAAIGFDLRPRPSKEKSE